MILEPEAIRALLSAPGGADQDVRHTVAVDVAGTVTEVRASSS